MTYLLTTHQDHIATVTLSRGKVNAINEDVIVEFNGLLDQLENDSQTRAIILTGQGKFFSFGWDVPELYSRTPDEFTAYVRSFCKFFQRLYTFPKGIVAALNGHAVAGGFFIAVACDYRVITDGKAIMSLNEVTFGASLFASIIETLRNLVGSKAADEIVMTGQMYSPHDAFRLGLVNRVVPEGAVLPSALETARVFAINYSPAFVSLKQLLRQPVVDAWLKREENSIREFVNIWYSPETREKTKLIQIR